MTVLTPKGIKIVKQYLLDIKDASPDANDIPNMIDILFDIPKKMKGDTYCLDYNSKTLTLTEHEHFELHSAS